MTIESMIKFSDPIDNFKMPGNARISASMHSGHNVPE